MLKPSLALLLLFTAATAARAEHDDWRSDDRGRDRGSSCDDRGRERDRNCDGDRGYGRDRGWGRGPAAYGRDADCHRDDRERCSIDRYDRGRCDRRSGHGVSLVRFVVRAIEGRHYRHYDCGCRHSWRPGYYETVSRRGDRVWVPGHYASDRSCRSHRA